MSAFAPAADPATRAKAPDFPQSGLAAVAISCLAGLWALAWHLPALGLRGPDDGFFMAVAHLWNAGAPPYLNAFDVKPPGFFALLALAQRLFGASEATLNGLTAVSDAVAAIALWRIGRRLGGPCVGVFAAFAYPALSQMLAANPIYPPLAAATATAFALALLPPFALTVRAALAGLAIGFAITIKQTAFLEALVLMWIILREREVEGHRRGVALAFAAGAATAPLAFALIFAAEGAFAPLVADVVKAAIWRPEMEGEPLTQNVARFLSVQNKMWPVAALAAIAATQWRWLFPAASAARAEGIALWFAASWVQLILQHSRWLNYLGPTFAPALLLCGAVIAAVLHDKQAKGAALALLFAVTVVVAYPFRIWPFLGPDDAPEVAAAARVIAERYPAPQDRLLAVDVGTRLNVVTGLAPPTPYFHFMHLLCDFPGAGPERLRQALAAQPRFVVLASRPPTPSCLSPTARPSISEALTQSYRRIAQTPEDAPQIDIYERVGPKS